MRWSCLILVFILILTVNCRRGANDSDCKYGQPTAIFNESQPGIQSHTFSAANNTATEEVTFVDGLQLTLLQSGCNEIRQEFQFTLTENFQEQAPTFWIEQSIQYLRRLGSMGPAYSGFSTWAQIIEEQRENIKLAESTEIQPGFFVTIDRIIGANSATLVLTLSDTP